MSKVAVIGAGYVGLTTAACLADLGNDVTVVDVNREKVERLQRHEVPFYEPGLTELVQRNAEGRRLRFTTAYADAIPGAEYAIIAVSTPEGEGGEADLSYVESAATSIADHMDGPLVVVNKSTVPPLTGDRVSEVLRNRNSKHETHVVSNPEFLREGSAIQDFMHPDRVVVGSHDRAAAEKVAALYESLEAPIVITPNIYTAEMVKYASNAFLAAKISFINEIARICERVDADAKLVAEGMGFDRRIGPQYLDAGIGFGGSCLAADETVLVRVDGRVRLTSIANAYAAMQAASEVEVLAWRRDAEDLRFMPVSAATVRPFEGELLEIRTKMGRRVRVTPDHPFAVKGGAKLASELTVEDWLPLALGHDETEPIALNVIDGMFAAALERSDVMVRLPDGVLSTVRTRDLRPTLAFAASHDAVRSGVMRLHEADALSADLMGASLKTVTNGTEVPLAIEANAAFWRIVGLYLAEGHISNDGERVRIQWSFNYTGEDELVEEVRSFWAAHGVKADVRRLPATTAVTVSSRVLAGFLLGVLGVGRNGNEARMPDQIWNAPAEHKLALLAGYWHGDGSWSLINGGPSVILECGTTSAELADGLLRLLADVGIVASRRIGRTSRSTRDTHWIRCSGADQVERLLDFVSPPDRITITKSMALQQKRIAGTGYSIQGRHTAWVRVVDIRPVPYSGAVYSLEVPDAHTFVTTGGLVTHNCFPKDVKALAALAERFDYHPELLHAVMDINRDQRMLVIDKLRDTLDGLNQKVVGLLGLAFKPNTDDLREAPSLDIAKVLLAAGAQVRGYDPAAMENMQKLLPDMEYCKDAYEVATGADAIVVVTEWNEFRHLDLARIKASMRKPVLIDGRNIYVPATMRELGFTYRGIGRE